MKVLKASVWDRIASPPPTIAPATGPPGKNMLPKILKLLFRAPTPNPAIAPANALGAVDFSF